jgi:hypothetical protein
MDTVYKCGQMEPSTGVIGKITELMDRAVFGMQMETNLKANSGMTSRMAKVHIHVKTVQSIKECGLMMFSTARAKPYGRMVQVLLEIIWKEKSTELELTNGQKGINTRANGKIT